MALLARRRTSQAVPYLAPIPTGQNVTQQGRLEPNYDPRIKGTRVHDFSAPRPRRNVSQNDIQTLENGEYVNGRYQRSPNPQNGEFGIRIVEEDQNRWSGGNHTPVFTEDFDEEQYPAAGPHVRKANDISDLSMPRPPYAKGAQQRRPNTAQPTSSLPLHGLADHASINIGSKLPPIPNRDPPTPGPPVPPKGTDDSNTPIPFAPLEDRRVSHISIQSGRSLSSVKGSRKGRPRDASNFSAKEAAAMGLPKHMKSTSSRFSFDMIGAASQEKLLEDRHRQKALEKSASPDGHGHDVEEEDEYDYDNMDDDDGLEEEIPMNGADLYDDEPYEDPIPGADADMEVDALNIDRHSNSMAGFTFHSMSTSTVTSPNNPYSPGMVSTPRDANGEVIGFAMSKESPQFATYQTLQPLEPLKSPTDPQYKTLAPRTSDETQGLGLQDVEIDHENKHDLNQQHDPSTWKPSPNAKMDDDDMYFDDGLIDDLDDGEERHEFDESVFDNDDTDEYGRPLRPLSSLPTLYSPPYVKDSGIHDQSRLESERNSSAFQDLLDHDRSGSPTLRGLDVKAAQPDSKHPQVDQYGIPVPQAAPSLTQDTLSAYQSALAAAAHNAVASGRFRRDSSPVVHFDELEDGNQNNKVKDSSPIGLDLTLPQYPDDTDDFDYDDALEDDDIIAEANREALENDGDGFYGQEFGFYSAPAINGDAQYGGYFGPRGDGIVRSQSGRVAGREPNLTPITERSEYSNRNSFMSLPLSGVSGMGQHTLNSPGLAQLAGMMGDDFDDNMSLTALLRLRRGAWGGSQASLKSSNGNGSPLSVAGEDASPINQLSPWAQSSSAFGHARKNSTFSLASDVPSHVSEEDESEIENSAPASPTLTMNTAGRQESMSSPTKRTFGFGGTKGFATDLVNSGVSGDSGKIEVPPPPAGMVASLQNRPLSPTMRRHRHTGSADSISYMKEDDPVQGERWVLERRRTAESGEVEILGREVVKGGRI